MHRYYDDDYDDFRDNHPELSEWERDDIPQKETKKEIYYNEYDWWNDTTKYDIPF